ncbi:IclR family transcriptional regulator [Streptomyces sp. MZ04]|uniref:IclR family transcriptional regulator n=1 Tax=Streptomyces sp. MZ04 TaxID=2559236 RepID=UPI00107EDD69|nr:IclR family transcriptional regulator [Streptomyces sp. MZ04]TGA90905.1 IclR family transcriptional regulator [Streptomyces sp. MZ04]
MIQSVQRAMQVLRELADSGPRLGVTEIAERVGVAKPTVHALLRTLESDNLVTQDQESGKYMLGPALLRLGNAFLETHVLRTRSVAWADGLAARTGEAVWVGVLTEDQVLVVHHAFRPEGAVQILEVGASLPWNTCALGKAMAAFLSPAEQQRLLAGELLALTGKSITDAALLAEDLDHVRTAGYAVEDQELALGDGSIAAPVLDRSGAAIGAIGVVGPVERVLADPRRHEHAVAVRETARILSRELGAGRTPLRSARNAG